MCFLHKRFFFFVAVSFFFSFLNLFKNFQNKRNFLCVAVGFPFFFLSFLIFKKYISVYSSCLFFFLFLKKKPFQKKILYVVVIVSFLFFKIIFQKIYIPFFACGCRFFSLIFLFFNLKNLYSISVCGCRSLSFSFLFNYLIILCGCQGFWVGL